MFILVLTKKLKLNKFISGTKATKQHEGLATLLNSLTSI
jgi:hypothetical protein